jgi:hypothetical protein
MSPSRPGVGLAVSGIVRGTVPFAPCLSPSARRTAGLLWPAFAAAAAAAAAWTEKFCFTPTARAVPPGVLRIALWSHRVIVNM